METLHITAPGEGALVRWRSLVFITTVPIKTPFMVYVFNEGHVWHRQPVPILRAHNLVRNEGYYEVRGYFGSEGELGQRDYEVVAVLSHRQLPSILAELPADMGHSNIVSVLRR